MPDQSDPTPGSAARSSSPWDVLVLLLFLAATSVGAFETAGSGGFACWLIGVLDVLIVREAWMRFRGLAVEEPPSRP